MDYIYSKLNNNLIHFDRITDVKCLRCEEAGVPIEGLSVGDFYMAFTLEGVTEPVYCDLSSLNDLLDGMNSSLIAKVNEEKARAMASENELSGTVSGLVTGLSNETISRMNGDDANRASILNEASTREIADNNLSSKIEAMASDMDSEIDRIDQETESLSNAIQAEQERATSRENSIEADLNQGLIDEENARITEDENIRSDLNDLSNSLSTVARSGSYDDLSNKPVIGDALITLRRNNEVLDTFSVNTTNGSDINIEVPTAVSELYDDLNLASMADVDSLRQEMMDGLGTKQDTLIFDSTPTGGSTNPVTSNGIYRATQAVREVAEGKCKSFTVSCGITLQGIQEAIRDDGLIVYDANGTDITESISDGTHMVFTDGLINPELNSQSADVSTFGYLANSIGLDSGRFVLDTLDNIGFKNGDNLYVVEVNVPDRWYDSNNNYLHILETSKPDLTNCVTTDTTQTIPGNKTFTAPITVDNGGTGLSRRCSTFSPLEWKMSQPGNQIDYVTIKPGSIELINSSWSLGLYISGTNTTATVKHGLSGAYTATFPAKSGTVAMTDDISNMATMDTKQMITAPKSFYNNLANDTLPVRIQGFANRTWGLEMDKDFGRFHLKTANANGTSISNVATQYSFDNGNFYPVGTKNLGTSSNKWTNVFMSGVLSDGNSSYGLALPDTTSFTANKTIATTDDLPKLYKHTFTSTSDSTKSMIVISTRSTNYYSDGSSSMFGFFSAEIASDDNVISMTAHSGQSKWQAFIDAANCYVIKGSGVVQYFSSSSDYVTETITEVDL